MFLDSRCAGMTAGLDSRSPGNSHANGNPKDKFHADYDGH